MFLHGWNPAEGKWAIAYRWPFETGAHYPLHFKKSFGLDLKFIERDEHWIEKYIQTLWLQTTPALSLSYLFNFLVIFLKLEEGPLCITLQHFRTLFSSIFFGHLLRLVLLNLFFEASCFFFLTLKIPAYIPVL